jgi:hypothetical protein
MCVGVSSLLPWRCHHRSPPSSPLCVVPTYPQTRTRTAMCHHVNSYFVVPTCTLSVHDHGRRPAILHPSEDRIHGPGCPCNSGTNPTRHCGTTFRTGTHTHGAYSRIPPRLHLLNLSSSTRSSMQHSRLLHLLRSSNRRHSSTPTSNAFPLYRSTLSTVPVTFTICPTVVPWAPDTKSPRTAAISVHSSLSSLPISAYSRRQFILRHSRHITLRRILESTPHHQSLTTPSSLTPGVYIHPALSEPSLPYDMHSRPSHSNPCLSPAVLARMMAEWNDTRYCTILGQAIMCRVPRGTSSHQSIFTYPRT